MEVNQPQYSDLWCNISGHGEHKRTAKVGKKKLGENEEEIVVAQKEVLGDMLVSVSGEQLESSLNRIST